MNRAIMSFMTDQTEPKDPLEKPAPVQEPALLKVFKEEPPQAPAQKLHSHNPMKNLDKSLSLPKEIGGQKGPEPTRYGDWESKGRCTDF